MTLRAHSYPRFSGWQHGMTLVEVLVTLVSASVGLLGVAALQLVSLKTNQEANTRLAATSLAHSMLEHIRSHRDLALGGAYDKITFNGVDQSNGTSDEYLVGWQELINETLPGGDQIAAGAIRRIQGTNVIVVTIRWAGTGGGGNVDHRELELKTEP